MATAVFTGIVERADEGFSVFFPDVPGCVSAGATLTEAMLNADAALAAHIQLLVQYREELPTASEEVQVDNDIEVVARFLARVDLPGRAVRLNITLDEGLVASIDRIASNRSGFIAEAAREALSRRRELEGA